VALKKLNTSTPPVTLNSNIGHYWGTTTTGNNILSGGACGTINTTGGYVYPSTTLITNPGSLQSSGTISWSDGTFMNSDIVEYIDIFYQLMGIDMDYKRFSEMTKEEKKVFIRDLKLKKLIDDK